MWLPSGLLLTSLSNVSLQASAPLVSSSTTVLCACVTPPTATSPASSRPPPPAPTTPSPAPETPLDWRPPQGLWNPVPVSAQNLLKCCSSEWHTQIQLRTLGGTHFSLEVHWTLESALLCCRVSREIPSIFSQCYSTDKSL